MAVTARCFLGGQGSSAHFADFVPQEKKYVAFIAACPSQHDKLSTAPLLRRSSALPQAKPRRRNGFAIPSILILKGEAAQRAAKSTKKDTT